MEEKTIAEHIHELKKHFIIIAFAFVAFIIIWFTFSKVILLMLIEYYAITPYALGPMDLIEVQLKFAAVMALVSLTPVLLYSMYSYCKEFINLRNPITWILNSFVLGLIGAFIGMTIVSKITLDTFKKITFIEYTWSVKEILGLVTANMLILAITLQLLLIIPLLCSMNLVTYRQYASKRWYILLLSLVGIAIVNPDPAMFSTFILYCPVVFSLEGGFLISKLMLGGNNVK
jgi:Sec-independent protein secretion pathway component TatC